MKDIMDASSGWQFELVGHLIDHCDHLVGTIEPRMELASCWNGRQIRDASQIASSLAFYDMRKSWLKQRRTNLKAKLEPLVLSNIQFIEVAQATLKFGNYMNDARGDDDQDLARIAHARADDHYLDKLPQQQNKFC